LRAAWVDRYGGPHVVDVREIDRPTPSGTQVLVRVEAASVNRADLDAITPRWALMRLFLGLRRPRTKRVGLDVAGVVEAVGEGATQLKVGDRVFADLFEYGAGAFAEYVCAPEKAFAPIPDDMPFELAATLPHAGVLAVHGLRLGNGRTVGDGDRVLVVGATGSVGPVVQIAKSTRRPRNRRGRRREARPNALARCRRGHRRLVASGAVRPVIDREFSLDEVVEALRWVDEGRARGKVLVRP
jgi:NADPH:quinone reductase-like Zn-dependent oxidoreductase